MYDQLAMGTQDLSIKEASSPSQDGNGAEVSPHFYPFGTAADIPKPGRQNAIDAAVHALEGFGVPTHVATAIAWTVCDPRDIVKKIKFPNTTRVSDATLIVIDTFVWTWQVAAYLANPRANTTRPYPVSGGGNSLLPAPFAEVGVDYAELIIAAESATQVLNTMEHNSSAVLSENRYTDEIGDEGIRAQLQLVPLTVNHDDGTPSVTMLTSIDGSSRVSSAQKNLNAAPGESIYPNAVSPEMAANQGRELLERCLRDPKANLAMLRSMTAPAQIVIGIKHDPGASPDADLTSAVRSVLGDIHISGPTPWSLRGELSVQGDSVVEALRNAECIDDTTAAWLEGTLSKDAVTEAGLSDDPTVRFATIVAMLLDSRNNQTVRAGLRAVMGTGKYVTSARINEVIGELALRSLPSVTEEEFKSMLGIITKIIPSSKALLPTEWAPTGRNAFEVLADAVATPATRDVIYALAELYIRGAFALIKERILLRGSRGGMITFRNSTIEPAAFMRSLIKTTHGQFQLAQAIDDVSMNRPVRFIDEDGDLVTRPNGRHLELSREDLYAMVPDIECIDEDVESPKDDMSGLDGLDRYNKSIKLVKQAAHDLDVLTEGMDGIIDYDGSNMAEKHGMEEDDVDMVRKAIGQADKRIVLLESYGAKARAERDARRAHQRAEDQDDEE